MSAGLIVHECKSMRRVIPSASFISHPVTAVTMFDLSGVDQDYFHSPRWFTSVFLPSVTTSRPSANTV
jgi:hypothetical protein